MKKFLMLVTILAMGLGLSLFPAAVGASPILDFNMDGIQPPGASISYAGGVNPLVGISISVDSVVGLGTPLNDGVPINFHSASAPDGAILSFSTGNLSGSGANDWLFSGGGSISLDLPTSSTGSINLFTGSFTETEVLSSGGLFKVVFSTFFDTKNPRLVALYGLPSNIPYEGHINLSFEAAGLPPSGFSSSRILSGDVTNTPVPEPATLLFLGSGLIGLAGFSRKMFRK